MKVKEEKSVLAPFYWKWSIGDLFQNFSYISYSATYVYAKGYTLLYTHTQHTARDKGDDYD